MLTSQPEEDNAAETFQAAVTNIWDQLGDCPREGTCMVTGKRQSNGPGTSVGTREELSLRGGVSLLLQSCMHGVLSTAGELKAKPNATEQQRKRPCP